MKAANGNTKSELPSGKKVRTTASTADSPTSVRPSRSDFAGLWTPAAVAQASVTVAMLEFSDCSVLPADTVPSASKVDPGVVTPRL